MPSRQLKMNQGNNKYLSDGKMTTSSVDQHTKGVWQMCTDCVSGDEGRKDEGCKVMMCILVTWVQNQLLPPCSWLLLRTRNCRALSWVAMYWKWAVKSLRIQAQSLNLLSLNGALFFSSMGWKWTTVVPRDAVRTKEGIAGKSPRA